MNEVAPAVVDVQAPITFLRARLAQKSELPAVVEIPDDGVTRKGRVVTEG